MARVTDPALLAELERAPASSKVVDQALLAELEGSAAPAPSTAAALGHGAAQGATLGFGDEIQGFIQSVLPPPGGDPNGYFGGMPQRYRRERDAARAVNERARQAHGTAYFVGNVAGGLAPTMLLPASRAAHGARLGEKAVAAARAAAPVGAVYGAGESTADDLGGLAGDALRGGALAAGLGAATPVAGMYLKRALAAASGALGRTAMESGRKALTGGYTPLSTKKPVSDEAVRAALDVGAIRPLRNSQGLADSLAGAREDLGQLYGNILSQLEAQGVHGPNARQLAAELVAEAQNASANSLASPRPGMLRDVAQELVGTPGGHMRPAVAPKPTDAAGNLGLMQTELMKRSLQQNAQSDFVREGAQSIAGETRMELAGRVRQAIEDAVEQQAGRATGVPTPAAAAFQPVKEQLSHVIEASNAASRAAARGTRLQRHSLTDTIKGAAVASQGGPYALPASIAAREASRAVRTRGPATWAWLADRGAQDLGQLAGLSAPRGPTAAAATLSPEVEALLAALRRRYVASPLTPVGADDEEERR